jgi:sugar/nucleoside kinase (ribokinase family)
MARILIYANINQDRIVRIGRPIRSGVSLIGRPESGRLGGGGPNTGVGLAMAGHEVALAAVVGDDALGRRLCAELISYGIDVSSVVVLPGATREVMIFVEPDGERTLVSLGSYRSYELDLEAVGRPADCLYVKSFRDDLAPAMARRLDNALVVAHEPPDRIGAWPAHIWITSRDEAAADLLADPFAVARAKAGEALRWVIVTAGPDGATAFGPEGRISVPAVPNVAVVDTTGAGDAFTAGLIHGLMGGKDMTAAMSLAAAWAAVAVGHAGSIPPPELKSVIG